VTVRRLILLSVLVATPAAARDSLGMFARWGAFRDPAVPRCYAIAKPDPGPPHSAGAYADIGSWPRRALRGQFHIRLATRPAHAGRVILTIGSQRFALAGGGLDAWAADPRMDAAVVAAMRSASTMALRTEDAAGKPYQLNWTLDGAASAMDSALVGCAGMR
jgi:hypothetical protein